MKNDELTQLWNSQPELEGPKGPEQLIKKAQSQRSKQYIWLKFTFKKGLVHFYRHCAKH